MFVCFYKNNNAIHKDTQQDLSSETWIQKADVISSHMLAVPTHQKASFSWLPKRIKMGGGIRTGRAERMVLSQLLLSCAHCDQHSGLCTTEDIQHGTLTCPSWGYPTAFSHFGLHVLSCLHTTRPLVPHLSTQVFYSQEWASQAPTLISFHTLQEHAPYSH